ncbi:hypothetical protein [Clostridium sp. BNL1100]|uniref:hypothetical protein n=1 Tax=Clostridium sp. BNL1100 TaxID=755731 RepID=UPI00024A7E74|nr:hypothetical protein [Clostridium sp. BNL1100]AEY67560.1 hypothetical protein Clo1100_3427 [Clostridium sp. BNL1100]
MKEYITLEQFVQEHPDQVIEIMSPGGYVTIHPAISRDKLYAHAGVSGTEMPISWDELKEQVVEDKNCNYSERDGRWYLLSEMPSQDGPEQAPELRL